MQNREHVFNKVEIYEECAFNKYFMEWSPVQIAWTNLFNLPTLPYVATYVA